jgi:magnesium chelatase family protein
MIASFPSAALLGVDAYRVDVEVDVAPGLPSYLVVGLPAASVKEGATRIRSALRNCGQDLPTRRVTVNLAPADQRKDGAAFDLPIAIGVVAADGVFVPDVVRGLLLLGELGLDGTVRRVRGVLAAATLARELGLRGVLVPRACAAEAAVVRDVEVYAVDHLAEVLAAMQGTADLPRFSGTSLPPAPPTVVADFAEVCGQAVARRAVEIAVAGGHNLLLHGPPGIGKTMIARRVPGILPEMSLEERIEVTRIYSAAGLAPPEGLIARRPFRAPHHSISIGALVGGGTIPRPGEISLAHRGVLFLDEMPEFPRPAVEALRQPLEDRAVRIGRIAGTVEMPASFLLVASANPCPCGWHGCDERACTCSLGALGRYRGRLSGPILDRIDLQVRVGQVSLAEMRGQGGESSATIRARVDQARARQAERLGRWRARCNAEMPTDAVRATCRLTAKAERALAKLYARRGALSGRGLDRLLRTARTICDLEGQDAVDVDAVLEAASYRTLADDPLVPPLPVGLSDPASAGQAGQPDTPARQAADPA